MTVDNYGAHHQEQPSSRDALLHMHIVHHATYCILTRISLPGMLYSLDPAALHGAPPTWINEARKCCYENSLVVLQMITAVAGLLSGRTPLDPGMAIPVVEVARNLVHIAKLVDSTGGTMPHANIAEMLRITLDYLARMHDLFPVTRPSVSPFVASSRLASLIDTIALRRVVFESSWRGSKVATWPTERPMTLSKYQSSVSAIPAANSALSD